MRTQKFLIFFVSILFCYGCQQDESASMCEKCNKTGLIEQNPILC